MTGAVSGLFGGGEGGGGSVLGAIGDAAGSPLVTGLMSGGQSLLNFSASQQKSQSLLMQRNNVLTAAGQADFAASQELLAGRESAVQVQQALARTLASQVARYAAGGIAVDSGTPATVAGTTTNEANAQLAIVRGNATIKAGDQTIRAQQLRQQAALLTKQAHLQTNAGYLGLADGIFGAIDKAFSGTPGTEVAPGSATLPGF
jgi:hypothetical protein